MCSRRRILQMAPALSHLKSFGTAESWTFEYAACEVSPNSASLRTLGGTWILLLHLPSRTALIHTALVPLFRAPLIGPKSILSARRAEVNKRFPTRPGLIQRGDILMEKTAIRLVMHQTRLNNETLH